MYTPMDYLKKIQQALKKSTYTYNSNGRIHISGKSQLTIVKCNLPDGNVIVANNPPVVPIELDLPNVFDHGNTSIEIAELEDHLFLNDIFNLGDYKIKKGAKARFVQAKKKNTSGTATVKFVGGKAKATHFDKFDHMRRTEDEELVLEINVHLERDQENEELKLLGLID